MLNVWFTAGVLSEEAVETLKEVRSLVELSKWCQALKQMPEYQSPLSQLPVLRIEMSHSACLPHYGGLKSLR